MIEANGTLFCQESLSCFQAKASKKLVFSYTKCNKNCAEENFLHFSPVKPESGIIPSGQLNYSNFEHLNLPGKELNVTDITEQQLGRLNLGETIIVFKRN